MKARRRRAERLAEAAGRVAGLRPTQWAGLATILEAFAEDELARQRRRLIPGNVENRCDGCGRAMGRDEGRFTDDDVWVCEGCYAACDDGATPPLVLATGDE
jgi:hypothetical protein